MIGAAAAAAVAAGAVGLVVARRDGSTASAGTPTAAADVDTATVATRDIRRTTSLDGTIGHGTATPLVLAGNGMLTWLPAIGTIVTSGQRVAEVDGRPVVLLTGERPAWRELGPGVDDGADVRQLEQALSDLGFATALVVDDEWTSATTTAVKTFQKWMGLEVDGRLALGEIVFGPATARVDTVAGHLGDAVSAAGLEVTGDQQLIIASVEPSDSDLVAPGTEVDIELPSGRTVRGVISAVGDPTTEGGTTTLPVTIVAVGESLDAVDGLGVDVEVSLVEVPNATAVPAAALLALAEGGYAVEVPDASSSTGTRLVGVEVGAFDEDGWVQVTGEVQPGDEVIVP